LRGEPPDDRLLATTATRDQEQQELMGVDPEQARAWAQDMFPLMKHPSERS